KGMIAEAPSSKPLQRWMYGSKGLQNKNMYEWSELQPYKKGDPATWDHQYIFEYCVCCTDNPNKTGDHTWIRLKTPEGDIYSVGLYRPSKRDWRDNYKFPLRLKKGYLMQPDVSEFWPTDIFKIPVAITKEHFLQMKKMLETDKRNDKLVFQLFHRNCTLYVAKIAAIAHIKLPTAKLAWHFLTPSLVEKKIEKIALYLPEIVVKIVRVVVGVFLNFFLLALGATIVDAAVFEKNNQQEPHIKNLSDFFDYRKTELNHPNILGKEIAAGIAKWRTSEIARLEKLKISGAFKENEEVDAEIKRVRFALPAAYYTL
ncbi:MAG: hypothetical protein JWO53_428, partial [Chlamydiia bacterium]|nr:hypothetical protein [Chlamydiia bacterium]